MNEWSIWLWVGFLAFVAAMLAIDLGVFNRHAHAISLKEAGIWSAVWISLALAFGGILYLWRGSGPSLEYLTGYLIEKALSVDNLFVFVLIFGMFAVPAAYQHRVLFWGVLGALVMRGAFIAAGAALLERFQWIMYIFGAFLVFTGIKLASGRETEVHPEKNPVLRLVRRVVPIANNYHGERFFIRSAGRVLATPLLLVLVVVETSDLMFAVDSIPAVFAVTRDPFLVFTSNVFAILGLRSLYFLLAGAIDRFYYLRLALAGILTFVGAKMLLTELIHLPTTLSLGVIMLTLLVAMGASLLRARRLAGREVQAASPAD